MRTPIVAFGTIPFTIAALISCGGDDQGNLGPTTGSLRVTTRSGGIGTDPDGYVLRLDGATEGPIGDPAPVVLTSLAAGDHTIALDNVVAFCAVDGGLSRTVAVPAGDTADVAFAVTCQATGSLEVSVATSGGAPDLDGYGVSVDGHSELSVDPNGTLSVPDLVIGAHTVVLSGLAFNCHGSTDTSSSATVSTGSSTRVRFTVSCGPLPPWKALYMSYRPGPNEDYGQWDMFVADPGSGAVTGLAQSYLNEEFPVLSPTRTQVAFEQTDPSVGWTSIAVVNLDGSGLQTVATADSNTGISAQAPTWSPDGSKLAFTRLFGLYVINPDGTGEQYLGPFGAPLSWSPDGSKIAALGSNDGGYLTDIRVIPVDGTPATALTAGGDPESDVAWSPDGQRLAFTRRTMLTSTAYTGDVWVMNNDGLDQRRLTQFAQPVHYSGASRPRWSPDGKLILFQAGLSGPTDLWTIRPDGTGLTNLTNTPDLEEGYADWSPDGSKIVFAASPVTGPVNSDVFLMNADGSGRTDLSDYWNNDIP